MTLSDPSNCCPDRENCFIHTPRPMMQIFSVKLGKLLEEDGPVQLYGYIATRDLLDPLVNYIVNRSRDDPIIVYQVMETTHCSGLIDGSWAAQLLKSHLWLLMLCH